jgi:2-iminobutanoate/2-iminopropanoate deaminase
MAPFTAFSDTAFSDSIIARRDLMPNTTITAPTAPAALGPYSQAVVAGEWVFTAGQIGLTSDGTLKETIEAQTLQALQNLAAVLTAAGGGWRDVVKTTVYLTDLADFEAFNAVYAEVVEEPLPARSTVQVSRLPKDALVEIDAIARLSR